MLMKDICTTDVVCCAPGMRVVDAAQLMRERHVGNIVVVPDPRDERTPIGILTDRDIVVEVIAQGRDPGATRVEAVMRKPVVIAGEAEDASEVLARMRAHGVRRLPVVAADGTLAGIVSLDDLLGVVVEDVTALLQVVTSEQKRERHTRR